jgi:D-tyrosyl-tRNA(Tyr) deacylase
MRAVVQRVSGATVSVDGNVVGRADRGLLAYLGVAEGDGEGDADYLAEKVANLRIFEDDEGKMNRSILDVGGSALAVSQFTLLADVRKGRRPSYSDAAAPDVARILFDRFVASLRGFGVPAETGVFQAAMRVSYTNEGPVTILLDSRKLF